MKDFVGNAVAGRTRGQHDMKPANPSGPTGRASSGGRGVLGAVVGSMLAAGLAKAATLPDGFVVLGSGMGVASARVLADGTLELTLEDGSVRIYGAGDFVVLEGGGIAVSSAVLEDLAALAEEVSGTGVASGAAAGLLGVAAAAAGGSGSAEPAVSANIGGDVSGAVVEDAAATLTVSGALTVADPNAGEAVFVAQASAVGTYGTFTLTTAGSWSYTADNSQSAIQELGAGDELTDSFTAVTADGTTQVVTVTITGVNDVAVITGSATGAVTEDGALTDGDLTASGALTVTDADADESAFVAQTDAAGSNGNGVFQLGTDGA